MLLLRLCIVFKVHILLVFKIKDVYIITRLRDTTAFVVLEFHETTKAGKKTVDLVPVSWICKKRCKWYCQYPSSPDYKDMDIWLKESRSAEKNWVFHEVEILSQSGKYIFSNVVHI